MNEITTISSTAIIMQAESFNNVMRMAEVMASGRATVPKHLQGNVADCAAIVLQSMQWNMNPFPVAQKTFNINGVLGYESQLVNAVINSCAPTKDRLNFEWFGAWEKIVGKFKTVESKTKKDDDGNFKKYIVPAWESADEQGLGVRVWATLKGEDSPRELTLLMSQARTRNSTLWTEDPKQQIAYLAIKRWSRLYCPDVILGVYTPDELEEPTVEKDITPKASQTPAQPKALPEMANEKFMQNFAAYEKGIITGRKSVEDVIVTLSSAYALTEDQINAIKSIKAPIEGEMETVQ